MESSDEIQTKENSETFILKYKPVIIEEKNQKQKRIVGYLNDESGICYLIKNLIPEDHCKRLFRQLYEETSWYHDTPTVAGKTYVVRRKIATYSDLNLIRFMDNSFSEEPISHPPWKSAVTEIKNIVETITQRKFNFVVINLYHDGKDSIGWHADREQDYQPGHIIASFTLGVTRDFMIRPYTDYGRSHFQLYNHPERLSIPLEAGDLLVMAGNMQHHYKHCVPKRAGIKPVKIEGFGETYFRINLTFRQILE